MIYNPCKCVPGSSQAYLVIALPKISRPFTYTQNTVNRILQLFKPVTVIEIQPDSTHRTRERQ